MNYGRSKEMRFSLPCIYDLLSTYGFMLEKKMITVICRKMEDDDEHCRCLSSNDVKAMVSKLIKIAKNRKIRKNMTLNPCNALSSVAE